MASRSEPAIQIGRQGVTIPPRPGVLDELKDGFARHDHVHLPSLIEPRLLEALVKGVAPDDFVKRVHRNVGVELSLSEFAPASRALDFVTNCQELFDAVQAIAACPPIRNFQGRVLRMTSGHDTHDDWHDDRRPGRFVAMSINVSAARYYGGSLELRTVGSSSISSVANLGFGDALLFRISDQLEHRIAPVEGPEPRDAFAGWFGAELDPVSAAAKNAVPDS